LDVYDKNAWMLIRAFLSLEMDSSNFSGLLGGKNLNLVIDLFDPYFV